MATVVPNLDSIVAHMKPVKAEVKKELKDRARRVQAVVDAHIETGEVKRNSKTTVGRTDSTVYIADPDIVAINYGHTMPNGKWLDGIHAIEAAL